MTFKLGFGLSFPAAIDAAERRGVVMPDEFYDVLPARLRQYAFTATGVTALDQAKAVLDSLNAKIARGGSFQEWKKEALDADWSIPKHRLELVARNHAQTAYMAGHWVNFREDQRERPFLMYSAINDSRTRPAHRLMSGHIAPVGDPLWLTWSPPCGHNCRCSLLSLTAKQAQARGLGKQVVPNVQPDPGWGHPPLEDDGDRMRQMAIARARDAAPQFVTALERLLQSGYTVPPLSPEQTAFAIEKRELLRAAFGTRYDALTDAEIWALRQYAADSFPVNAFMRDLAGLDDEGKRDMINVQSAIRRLSDGEERTTFRGSRSDPRFDRVVQQLVPGKVMRSRSFFSTSGSELRAQEFGNRYFFTIRGRSSVNVDGFYHDPEQEFIFPSGVNFRVVKVTNEGGLIHIELEETKLPADFLFAVH